MKRLVLFAAVVALAACAKKDETMTDTATAMVAPAMAPAGDSAMRADSMRMDSIRRADSARGDTTKH